MIKGLEDGGGEGRGQMGGEEKGGTERWTVGRRAQEGRGEGGG